MLIVKPVATSVAQSVVRAVQRSVRTRTFVAALTVGAVLGATLFGARMASASLQVQSYQRASESEACVAQPGETPWEASWGSDPSWKPTWEQWANAGTGGWTCTRSITWAKTQAPASSGSVTYALGSIGPGGGLVFLISGGLTYEMAPKTWTGSSSDDTPAVNWCSSVTTNIAGAVGTSIGAGSANSTAMQSPACVTGAAVSARAYGGGGFTDWFLPSKDELNAMYSYSLVGGFNTATYGFASDVYWSSSQSAATTAWLQNFVNGTAISDAKAYSLRDRPVRSF